MNIIDGNKIAKDIIEDLKKEVGQLGKDKPTVAFIRVGEDPASISYVRKKKKTQPKLALNKKVVSNR